MTYTRDIPATGQTLGETREPIKENFNDIDTKFQVDHQEFNETNGGKHKQTTLIEDSSNPTGDKTTGTDEVAIYAKQNLSKTRPFIRYEGNGLVKSLVEVVSYGSIQRVGGALAVGSNNNFNMLLVPTEASNVISVTLSNALLDANYNLTFSTVYDGTVTYSFAEDTTFTRTTTRFDLVLTKGGNRAPIENFPAISVMIIGNLG